MHHNGKNDCVRKKERGHANKPERALMRWKQVMKKEVLPTWGVCRTQVLDTKASSEPFTWCNFSSSRRGMVMEENLSPCSPAIGIRSVCVCVFFRVFVTTRRLYFQCLWCETRTRTHTPEKVQRFLRSLTLIVCNWSKQIGP